MGGGQPMHNSRVSTSVGTRIYAAIAVTAALTVVASVLAFWSFAQIGRTMQALIGERFPVVEISGQLAEAASSAVRLASKLADATTLPELDADMAALSAVEQRMREEIGKLPPAAATDGARMLGEIDRLARDLKGAYEAARERLALSAEKSKRLAELASAHEQLTLLFVTIADEALFDLTVGLESAGDEKDPQAIKQSLQSLSDRELPKYGGTLTIAAEANQLYGLMRELLLLSDKALLVPTKERYTAISQRLGKALVEVEKSGENSKRRSVVESLLGFGAGERSLFALRERDFVNRAKLAETLTASIAAATDLQKDVRVLVGSARAAAHDAVVDTGSLIAENSWWLAAISMIGILLALAIALFYVRPRIVERMRRLWRTTEAIAEGRLDTPIDSQGRDEIADIARAVGIFRDSALERERLVAENERSVDEQRRLGEERERLQADRVRAGEAESARAARINTIVEEFRTSIAHILTQLRDTSQRLGTAASNMNEVSSVVSTEVKVAEEKIGVSSQHVADTAGSTEDLARTIKRIEEEAVKSNDAVGRAMGQFQRAVGTMSTLDSAASRIDEVVNLIQSIARKTNLLALNASIEAARAGTAGRGFAVVAQEVKSLAGQTAQATEDVTAQIGSIQTAATEARQSMVQLDSIIAQVSGMAESVADTVAEQSASVTNISRGANFASAEAKSGSAAISRVANVSTAARATAGEVKTLAGSVAGDAERLDEHVERFLQAVRAA